VSRADNGDLRSQPRGWREGEHCIAICSHGDSTIPTRMTIGTVVSLKSPDWSFPVFRGGRISNWPTPELSQ